MVGRQLVIIILIGLAFRIAYAVAIYDPSLLNYNLDDFTSYRIAAEEILGGDLLFTNPTYMKRPPVYSLLVAALGKQPALVIAANILLGIAVVALTYALAKQLKLSQAIALLAAFIVALDPTSIRASAILRADALADFWLALAFVCFLLLRQAKTRRAILLLGLASGGFVMLSALTRPAAYLLWIPMALWIFFARGGGYLAAAAVVLPGLLVVSLWSHHNDVYFENRSFSSAGTFQLLYVRAASVMHQATGEEINQVYASLASEVEKRLGNNFENITANRRHSHLASSAAQAAVMTDIAVEIFRQYPLQYALTIPVGLYRAFFPVSVWTLWNAIFWNVAFIIASAYGLLQFFRAQRFSDAAFLLLPCVYFIAGTLLVATASYDSRARVMLTPLMAVMAAYGIQCFLKSRKAP